MRIDDSVVFMSVKSARWSTANNKEVQYPKRQ